MGRRKARLLCAPDLLHAHCSRHGRPWHVEVVGRDSSSSIASRRKVTLEMNEVGVEGHVVLIPRAKKALHRSLRAIKWLISQFCQNFVKNGLSGVSLKVLFISLPETTKLFSTYLLYDLRDSCVS